MNTKVIKIEEKVCLDQYISGPDGQQYPFKSFLKRIDFEEIEYLFYNTLGPTRIADIILSAFTEHPLNGIRHIDTYYTFYKTWIVQLSVNVRLFPRVLLLINNRDIKLDYTGNNDIVLTFKIKDHGVG